MTRRVNSAKKKRGFTDNALAAIRKSNVIGLRAGTKPHRFIAVWAVVVEGRVFIRSWSLSPRGWYFAFLEEPLGAIQVDGREIDVRAVRTRSERLKDAVSQAYRGKYRTPGSIKFVRDFARTKCRNTTTEVVPPSAFKEPGSSS